MKAFAPGKIILSGEYAVVFGFPGIAIPLPIGVHAEFAEDSALGDVNIAEPNPYVEKIVALCKKKNPAISGILNVRSDIPVGKGIGSSSATVIAVTRVLLGDDTREIAREIENVVAPQSALDFTTIWENTPTIFQKDSAPRIFEMPKGLLNDAFLIDTGTPNETTSELVAWMKSREKDIREPLATIGTCTNRLMRGESLLDVMRAHNKAQIALGVVPEAVQKLIRAIESHGGAAKVIGAGGRTGGAGLVLALEIAERWKKLPAREI